jgi:hypothetical protein
MANPTTNFNWQMPTPSDLVTDLPADFDVALQGVDTRLKALQPGTTLGDIAYSSATANTNTRLGIGSTGQVLTVAGGVPSWATPSGSSGPAFRAFRNTSTQTIAASNTWTKVQFNGETFDTDSCFDSTTNYRFTPTTAGYYQINLNVYNSLTGNPSYVLCAIYKNGSSYSKSEVMINGQNYAPAQVSDIVYLNGSSDYVEGYALQQLDSTITNGSDITNFSGTWIRG